MESGGRRALNLAEDPDELRALLLLRLLPGAGDRRIARVLREHGSARRALALARKDFTRALGSAAFRERSDATLREQVEVALRRCRAIGALAVGLGSERYPKSLLALADPPAVLFLRGDPALLDRRAIAIVGARRATSVGRRTAERMAGELSEHGVAVVSGLALGIDGAAHRGALSGAGGTIAVLGCGPDRAYPATNRGLFEQILERGLLVTEFFPGEAARPYNFPRRNRILAGLCAGVVVVEAAERSGALITVDHALDLGIEVFSVPGSVEAAQSKGSNHLLRDGAYLVTSGSDVLDIMRWPRSRPPASGGAEARPGSELSLVSRVLGPAPQPIHDIVPAVGLPVQTVLASLTRLEVEGRAVRSPDGWRARGYPR